MVQDGPISERWVSSTHSVDSGIVPAKGAAADASRSPQRRRRSRDGSSQTDGGGVQQQLQRPSDCAQDQSSHDASPPTKPQAPSSTGAAAADEQCGDDGSGSNAVATTLSRDLVDAGDAMLTPPKRESPGTSVSVGSSGGESVHRSASHECGDLKPSSTSPLNPRQSLDGDAVEEDEYNRHPTCNKEAAPSDTSRPKRTSLKRSRRRRQNGTEMSTQQLSKRNFDGTTTKRRSKTKTNRGRKEMAIPPFPMPMAVEETSAHYKDQKKADEDDDGAVIFQSLSSGDELDGTAFQYALNGPDQDGESSDDSTVGSESTSNSRLDRLLDKYFPDEMGGQGSVPRSTPSSPKERGASCSNTAAATAAAGPGSSVASPHREMQRVWAGRALSNPLLRGENSIPSLSPTRMSQSSLEGGTKSPDAGLQMLDGAPPMPLTMKSSPAMRLSPRGTSLSSSMGSTYERKRDVVRSASPPATVVKTTSLLELSRTMSEGSVIDHHTIHRSLSQDLSARRTCFPRAHSASAVQGLGICVGLERSPRHRSGCCGNGITNGDFRSLLVGYVPDFCGGTSALDDDNTILVADERANVDDVRSIDANNMGAARGQSPTTQLASSPESQSGRQRRSDRANQSSMSLGMSLWLEDVHRQHQIKEQNRCRMVAAMAKAARAHSQLSSLNDHDDSYGDNDHDLASKSLDFDDLGQLGGFNINRGNNMDRRTNTLDLLVVSGTNKRRSLYDDDASGTLGRGDSASSNSAGIASDSDSDDEYTDELLAERELARRARKIREEIRRAEMEELAREAERAAEAGEEKFVGAASTFDVVLAASAAVSKQAEEESAPMKSWRSGEPVPDKRRPWECMFDAKPIRKKASVEPPSSPMKEWMKNALAAPPSSPMVGWVSSAIAMYDPTTPAQSQRVKSVQHSPVVHPPTSVQVSLKKRSNSLTDSYHPTTPLRRTATSRTETTIAGSSIISALSTPLSDRKRIERVPVLHLRNIEDIVPNFGDIHLRLRTDMAGKGVQKEVLGGPSTNKRRDVSSDHRSAIGSDGSGSSFQNIAASLGNLLKTATFASGQRSIRSLSDVGDGAISEASATSPSSRRLPLPARRPPSRSSTAELSTRHIARLSGMSLDCTRAMRADSEKDARSVLEEQLGDWSDAEGGDDDDNSVASHDTNSTTDLYVSALTNEIHTPRNTGRKHKKLFADSPRMPPPIDDPTCTLSNINPDPLSTPDHKSRKNLVAAPPVDDFAIPDAVLSVNTPMGGKRIFSRTDEGGIVETRSIEACPSHHTDDLTLPDLTYSRSHDAGVLDDGADLKTPRSANSGAASRFSDPLSERRTILAAMELVSKKNAGTSTPKRLTRPTFSLTDNGPGGKGGGATADPAALDETYKDDNESKGGAGDSVHTPEVVGQTPSYSFDADTMYWDSDVESSEGSPGGLRSISTFNGGEKATSSMYGSVHKQLGFQ